MIMVLGSPIGTYSETSPCIVDGSALRSSTIVNGGMWDQDKETRQSSSNAAYDGVQSGWKCNTGGVLVMCIANHVPTREYGQL